MTEASARRARYRRQRFRAGLCTDCPALRQTDRARCVACGRRMADAQRVRDVARRAQKIVDTQSR
jgi:hypothetical protein